MIPRHFRSTAKVTSSVYKTPNSSTDPMTKAKLPGSREASIYHEPGTVSCKTVEDLKKLYPNSFDRLGSLKGAYNIRIGPFSQASDACQEEGANRVQRSNRQGTRLLDR